MTRRARRHGLPDVPRACVVVGVDGSAHADRATEWAAHQADLEGRALVLVHAFHQTAPPLTSAVDRAHLGRQETRRIRRSGARAVLALAALRAGVAAPEIPVHSILIDTDPRRALIALSRNAHLLVVGSRGFGPVRNAWLGSVSEAVSSGAACPTVVVRHQHPGLVRHGVLVGVEASANDRPVVEFAFEQASLHSLPLRVVHSTSPPIAATVPRRPLLAGADRTEDAAVLLSETVAGMSEKYPDVHVTLQLVTGSVPEVLSRPGHLMDLVVVGRPPPRLVSRLLHDSTPTRVLQQTKGVVAVVPTELATTVHSTTPRKGARHARA